MTDIQAAAGERFVRWATDAELRDHLEEAGRDDVPPGTRLAVLVSNSWSLPRDQEVIDRSCSAMRCYARPVVAGLYRGGGRGGNRRYLYCAKHLREYGNWVEAGLVVCLRLVDVGAVQ